MGVRSGFDPSSFVNTEKQTAEDELIEHLSSADRE
jgi:hypothetical protein